MEVLPPSQEQIDVEGQTAQFAPLKRKLEFGGHAHCLKSSGGREETPGREINGEIVVPSESFSAKEQRDLPTARGGVRFSSDPAAAPACYLQLEATSEAFLDILTMFGNAFTTQENPLLQIHVKLTHPSATTPEFWVARWRGAEVAVTEFRITTRRRMGKGGLRLQYWGKSFDELDEEFRARSRQGIWNRLRWR